MYIFAKGRYTIMKKVKIGMIGIGGYAELTLDDILGDNMSDYEIVATVDPYPASSRHFEALKKMGIPHFFDAYEMYNAGICPDLCVISTPIQFHKSQIKLCRARGSSVVCEKPMTGDIADIEELRECDTDDGFTAIGYQWSYSHAIQKLKADIMAGVYGRAKYMKTMVLWPRDKKYFKRSTGWAGKLFASNGEKILDSVANNATAHYIHNILYVLGDKTDGAAKASDIKADLIRTNDIETFDTAAVRFKLCGGAEGLYIVSHSTEGNVNPRFEYRFEKGTVTFSEQQGEIIGKTSDGKVINYGDPFADRSKKVFDSIENIKNGKREVLCGISAATAQVEFIAALHAENKIYNVKKDAVCETADERLYIKGLDKMLSDCYDSGKLLSETEALWQIAEI